MKPLVYYRIAAFLLVVFAAGHTLGFLTFRPPTAEGLSVLNAMNGVTFSVSGHAHSYGLFYRGFGLFISAAMLFQAALAWMLSSMSRTRTLGTVPITAALLALQIVNAVLAYLYFGGAPLALSLLLVITFALALRATAPLLPATQA